MSRFHSVLITGASRGIGAALARAYAAPGVHLALCARSTETLSQVVDACKALGAEVSAQGLDVRDAESLRLWVREMDAAHPLDLVIANAGIANTLARSAQEESWECLENIFATNVMGTLASIQPAIQAMRQRQTGQIGIVSSLGGFVGMPLSPAYNASKAAIKVYGEGIRGWLEPQGVGVSVICPGFVESDMSSAYPGPKPFMVKQEKAVALIQRGLERNRARITFPLPLALGVWWLSVLPPSWSLWLQKQAGYG